MSGLGLLVQRFQPHRRPIPGLTLESHLPVAVLGLQGTQRPLPAPWQDVLRRCAVNGVHLQALLPLPAV